jgi:hypothetical protein
MIVLVRRHAVPAVIALSILLLVLVAECIGNKRLSREELIDDVRQLAGIIEDAHPDPYIKGGGKIAFHRRLQNTLAAIPESGMTRDEFYRLLRPFVAAIGDAHTWLRDPYAYQGLSPGGIPLYFHYVEDSVYVFAVPSEDQKHLLGALLVAVEGVPFDEIVRRQGERIGAENEYQLLRNLAGTGVLWRRCFLEHLIPEWGDKTRVTVTLEKPRGVVKDYVLAIPDRIPEEWLDSESFIELPSTEKCDFVYDFLGDDRKTALLVVNSMNTYREAFEMWDALGVEQNFWTARREYERYRGEKAPGDQRDVIAGLPSATEAFRSMVKEMREAGTRNLLVDLRRNGGGNSYMSQILIYFLYGSSRLIPEEGSTLEIKKYSRYYFTYFENESLEKINEGRDLPLTESDYDFTLDRVRYHPSGGKTRIDVLAERIAQMPTFEAEYKAHEHDGYYLPGNVIVLCAPDTFSSGYTFMYHLQRCGAKILGTPSAQAGNCFGDTMGFKLENSGLSGTVSRKYYELFPDDHEKGRVLRPDYPLTYEKLASYNFDTNAEILYALEILRR